MTVSLTDRNTNSSLPARNQSTEKASARKYNAKYANRILPLEDVAASYTHKTIGINQSLSR